MESSAHLSGASVAQTRGHAVIPFSRRRPAIYSFGCLSRQDRGEDDIALEGRLPGAALHGFLPELEGSERLARFLELPDTLADAYWADLARQIEEGRV